MSIPRRRGSAGFLAVSLAAITVLLSSCGARTALDLGGFAADNADGSSADGNLDGAISSDSSDAMITCMTGDFTLTRETPAVVFLLDNSGSMADKFSGNQTRWQVLTSALATTLPPIDDAIQLGAIVFPQIGAGGMTCDVPSSLDLSPQIGNAMPLVTLMEGAHPHGGTPTSGAITTAAAALTAFRAGSNARALVLATDGAPNCNTTLDPKTCTCVNGGNCRNNASQCLDDTRTVATIASVFSGGLPTYVIGIADATDPQFSQVLDAMANAGGRPQAGGDHAYYAANSEADLQTALVTIRNQVGACSFLTTSVPSQSGTITVTANGVPVPFDPTGTGTSGWKWGDENNGEIIFEGSSCDASLAEGGALDLVAHVTCGSLVDAGDAGADASDTADASVIEDDASDTDGGM